MNLRFEKRRERACMVREEKVSVIVPVYNVGKYLKKCLNSLFRQSYPHFQIILVDDGSFDGSAAICDSFARKAEKRGAAFPEVKVFHRQNAGASAARNFGIDACDGEWIVFADGDDWLPGNALELLVGCALENEADYVVGAFQYVMPGRNFRDHMSPLLFYPTSSPSCRGDEEAVAFFSSLKYYSFTCKKLFKTDIIKKNRIRFDTSLKVSEDTAFILEYLRYCSAVKSLDRVVYYYNNLREDGSACRYYPDRSAWADKCLGLYGQAIDVFIRSEEERKALLSRYAALRIFRDVEEHLKGCKSVGESAAKCRETFDLLSGYVTETALKEDSVETKLFFRLKTAICEGIVEAFCSDESKRLSAAPVGGRKALRRFSGAIKKIRYFGL